jgi:hypothetical protein
MQRFHIGHGGPLDAKEVQRHAQALPTSRSPRPALSTAP